MHIKLPFVCSHRCPNHRPTPPCSIHPWYFQPAFNYGKRSLAKHANAHKPNRWQVSDDAHPPYDTRQERAQVVAFPLHIVLVRDSLPPRSNSDRWVHSKSDIRQVWIPRRLCGLGVMAEGNFPNSPWFANFWNEAYSWDSLHHDIDSRFDFPRLCNPSLLSLLQSAASWFLNGARVRLGTSQKRKVCDHHLRANSLLRKRAV